ncbi:MAG: choice-of-anchor D domain-containing protein [Myxococcaceae bacterium]|nr:choice-of-anchor D domain-containing protein [Myxococcaceae bacterium]
MRALWVMTFAVAVVAGGCRCREGVDMATPSLAVTPTSLDFGQVRRGERQARTVTFEARTQAPVRLASVTLEGGATGTDGFTLGAVPTSVEPFSKVTVTITFVPTALQLYQATLVVQSDDPDRPTQRIPVLGEGARPVLTVTPVCEAAQQCRGTVTVSPRAIDFGLEPLVRPSPIPASQLPGVVISNDGPVPLEVTKVAIEGPDAAAFTFAQVEATPWVLMPSEGRSPQLRFRPSSAAQMTWQAQLIVESNDPENPRVTVDLRGALLPNQAPQVCFNLIRATPPPPETGGFRDYNGAAQWAPLLMPPSGGYDFTGSRDVRPGDTVQFSAFSDAVDATRCTTDAESARTGLTYQWRLTTIPMGARPPTLATPTAPTMAFRPVVTGDYVVELTVSDGQASTTVTGRLRCAIKQDLVVQLEWNGFERVDLDLHLVRPSARVSGDRFAGVFQFFDAVRSDGGISQTSGDLNGYAVRRRQTIVGANFDWGGPGSADDPTLALDNTGMAGMGADAELVELASLNQPENDERCATTSCSYGVFVHYFADARALANAPSCTVTGQAGCRDGEACTCAMPQARCVAESAPLGDAGIGSGKCYAAPKPVVRIFARGETTPVRVIPLESLMPPDELAIGAPCQVLEVAEILWPARSLNGSLPDGGSPPPVVLVPGTDGGRVVSPQLGRFGVRPSGGLQCSADLTVNGGPWYGQNP